MFCDACWPAFLLVASPPPARPPARLPILHMASRSQELAGVAEWARPTGGMFLWVRLLGVADATEIWGELQRHKLVVLPGRVMHAR
jgi:hypothetical protein